LTTRSETPRWRYMIATQSLATVPFAVAEIPIKHSSTRGVPRLTKITNYFVSFALAVLWRQYDTRS
jgi:hypothetical protein